MFSLFRKEIVILSSSFLLYSLLYSVLPPPPFLSTLPSLMLSHLSWRNERIIRESPIQYRFQLILCPFSLSLPLSYSRDTVPSFFRVQSSTHHCHSFWGHVRGRDPVEHHGPRHQPPPVLFHDHRRPGPLAALPQPQPQPALQLRPGDSPFSTVLTTHTHVRRSFPHQLYSGVVAHTLEDLLLW